MEQVVVSKLLEIFESEGIYLSSEDLNREISLDSLQFVSIIINIEEKFLIKISEDFYNYDKLKDLKDYKECILSYVNGKLFDKSLL